MSFADTVREDLLTVAVRKNCCRRALIAGLFVSAVYSPEAGCIVARFRTPQIADDAAEQLRIQFAGIAERRRVGMCGRYYEEVRFSSPAFRKLVDHLHRPPVKAIGEELGFRCEECRAFFLRGLFLAGGTVNDPHKPVHLEFSVSEAAAPSVSAFFSMIGYPARTVARGKNVGFYFKESASVEDLLALMGAHRVIFDVINTRIEREIRNHENRVNNCDTRNLERTVSASARQMDAIERLHATGKLDNLPEELRETARLRYENPDASLDALAELHNPPITKSGLNHRLRRIVEAAGKS